MFIDVVAVIQLLDSFKCIDTSDNSLGPGAMYNLRPFDFVEKYFQILLQEMVFHRFENWKTHPGAYPWLTSP